MSIEYWIQYGAILISLVGLAVKWKRMKAYIPVGLFVSFYANIWCFIAMNKNWWDFPIRIYEKPDDVSWPANFVALPIIAMFWVRYCPLKFREKITWALIASIAITSIEVILERYTEVLKYHNNYDWYFSFVLWFISWFIWYGFHVWFYNGRKDIDTLFK